MGAARDRRGGSAAGESHMSAAGQADRFQRDHHWAALPIAVVYKFTDDQGNYLSALIAYYGLVSLVPLLLVFTSLLGFVLQANPHLQQQILNSALSQFPGIGTQITSSTGLQGSGVALVVGLLGALYGSLGAAQATQNAMNIAWAVPRNRRPNPIRSRLRSLAMVGAAGLAVLGATVLSALTTSAGALGADLDVLSTVLAVLASILLNVVIFVLAFRISTARKLTLREMAPGAITAALLWQVLQTFGTAYITHVVKHATIVNGTFAFVLGLIAWLYLAAVALVFSVEINVVWAKHLYPRALLTPFTDNVDLTHGDQEAYIQAAQAQRNKGFQHIDVSFDNDGQNASARTRDDDEQRPKSG
jgi:membrane protein